MADRSTTARVLVVSDDRDVTRFLGRMMEDAGLDTYSCVTDDIAIELASSNPAFDAVLGDGIDVDIVNRVRALPDPDRAGTPIVILASYHATEDDAGAAMAAGAAAYLTRPVVGKELVDAVRAALTSDDGPGGG